MLEREQQEHARARLAQLDGPLEIRLDPGPDPEDRLSRTLCFLLQHIVDLAAPKLRLSHVESGLGYPSFSVGNVTYLAAPVGLELDPFLELLVLLSHDPRALPPISATPVEPGRVELLIAPGCPSCPVVVRACSQVAAAVRQLDLVVIDVQHFAALAGSCRSVPTVIIDGTLTAVGVLSAAELVELLGARRQPGYLTRAMGSMIEAGRLAELVPLLSNEEGYAAMAALMREGSMQQKMGLMLAVEQALERDHHALDSALPFLLPLLASEDVTLRGDTADLLGRIGAPAARDALTALLADEHPDVRELAGESLAMLREPS